MQLLIWFCTFPKAEDRKPLNLLVDTVNGVNVRQVCIFLDKFLVTERIYLGNV